MSKINELRHSAVVLGSGPGAFLDLPRWSTIMSGLDAWPEADCAEVEDARLLSFLNLSADCYHIRHLRQPPVFDDPRFSPRVPTYVFPGWFTVRVPSHIDKDFGRPLVCFDDLVAKGKEGRERVFNAARWPEIGAALAAKGTKAPKKWPLVPVRFVRACRFGHCDDINWEHLVHGGHRCIGTARLWLRQTGATGELSDLTVHCATCDANYNLVKLKRADAMVAQGKPGDLGPCDGTAPWLRDDLGRAAKLGCGNGEGGPEPWRLLVRHATNAYFARTLSTLWLPPESTGLADYVEANWSEDFHDITSRDMLAGLARRGKVRGDLEAGGWTVDEVWAAIQLHSAAPRAAKTRHRDPRRPEIERILASTTEIGDFAKPTSDFTIRKLPRHLYAAADEPHLAPVSEVFLAHRIRVTAALRGFTRLEPLMFPVTSEVDLGVASAPLAHPQGRIGGQRVNWLPAIANRGEGFLVQLNGDAVKSWRQRPAVIDHIGRYYDRLVRMSPDFFRQGATEAQQREELASFMLLHSLSHALLQSVAMDCGYSPPSLSERIYNYDDAFAILLYTTSPDADGTLGGLVEAGRSVGRYIADALRRAALCSNDPVCATPSSKGPAGVTGARTVNGAACHACLLIAESSCERRNNDLLDRALLVPTVDDRPEADLQQLAFWPDIPE